MPRSAGLTAAAMTLIRTSPSAGSFTGRSCGRSSASGPTRSVAIVRIVVMSTTLGSVGRVVVDRDQSAPDPAERLRRDTDVRRDLALREPGREVPVAVQEPLVPFCRVGEQQLGLSLLGAQVERLGQPGDQSLPTGT